jgi:hypothetical protein
MGDKSLKTTSEANHEITPTRVAVSEDKPRGRLLKRGPVARMLGVSESSVRRLEKTVLPPVIMKGVSYQREQDVHDYLRRTRGAAESADDMDGATAAAAFELFDCELGPADVVRRLKLTPLAARTLHREWVDLRGGFVVGAEAAAKLERIPWLNGEFPVKSGDELVAMLTECAPDACGLCKDDKRPPQFCARCTIARRPAIERLVEAQQIEREAKREARSARALSRETIDLAQGAAARASASANT